MSSLGDVFRVLNEMAETRVIERYAIGGAMAALFYVEPTRTYDVDVFVTIGDEVPADSLAPLEGIYSWARARGFSLDAEHVVIQGVPVQFLPAYNALVADAIAAARQIDYEGVPVRVVDPEHLVALAIQAGGARRRERALQLLEHGGLNRTRLRSILARHGIEYEVPDEG